MANSHFSHDKSSQPKLAAVQLGTGQVSPHLRKTFISHVDFVFFALRDPFGNRFRRALPSQNEQKNIACTHIWRNQWGPC